MLKENKLKQVQTEVKKFEIVDLKWPRVTNEFMFKVFYSEFLVAGAKKPKADLPNSV